MLSNTVTDFPIDPAQIIETERYILVATLAWTTNWTQIFVWDLLNNILNDYKLLSKHRIRLPTVVYFISRLCALGYVVILTPVQSLRTPVYTICYRLGKILDVLFFLCASCTSLLLFFRTRAVFDRNPWIAAFFFGLWLAVATTGVLAIVGVDADETDIASGRPTNYCTFGPGQPKLFVQIAATVPMINDTLVFLAISWRLYSNSCVRPTLRNGLQVLIFGDYLPRFSKAMLQDGQAYYLTTVTINLLAVILLFTNSLHPTFRIIFWVPNVILMNIMACRVFRNTIFGIFREAEITTSFISREQRAEATPLPL